MEYSVVPMQKSHIAQIAELEKSCFSDPWPQSILENELQNPLAFWLVAERDGTVLGYVGSQIVPNEADMMNIAVREDCRGQKIAGTLLSALISGLKEKQVISLTLEVRASNAPAAALYRAFDFAQVGLRKNYYFHPKEDALIFKKEWSL